MTGKRKRIRAVRLGGGLLLALAVLASGAQPPAEPSELERLRACMRENLPETSFSQHIRLMSEDAGGGQQVLNARLYGRRGRDGYVDLMLSVLEPADLAGSRYLLVAKESRDDMYVYLPAVNRVRRVVGGMRGQPLWGTDFSYEDIKHLQSVLTDSEVEVRGERQREGRRLYQLALRPAAEEQSIYSRIEMDVDSQTCLIAEVRFFDEAGMFKRMHSAVDAYRQVEGRWVPGRVTMENLRGETHSELQLADVEYDRDLSRRYFNPKTFHLAN